MDWLSGLGWSGLITVAVCIVWDIFFPLNNLLIACVYIASFIAWFILEKLSIITRDFNIILSVNTSRVQGHSRPP